MKDKPKSDKPSDASQPDLVLGKVPPGGFDTELKQGPNSSQPEKGAGESRAAEDMLALPEGAVVAMRRSGGLRFTSKEIIVYHDGKVVVMDSSAPGGTKPPPPRKLRDKELAELYRALDKANFPALPSTSGRQNPDAYAYEIVARIGGASYSVEVFDGSIPEELVPLIQLLRGYMNPGPAASGPS